MGAIPVIDSLERNPFEAISNGDFVKVDAVNGTVEVFKKGNIGNEAH